MFVVYSIDYSNYNLEVYGIYGSYREAERNLHDTVIEFLVDEVGKKKAKIHRAEPIEDLNKFLPEIEDLYFANQESSTSEIILYKRDRLNIPGYIYNSLDVKTVKVRFFDIKTTNEYMELTSEIDETYLTIEETSNCNEEVFNNYNNVIDELRKTLSKRNLSIDDEETEED